MNERSSQKIKLQFEKETIYFVRVCGQSKMD